MPMKVLRYLDQVCIKDAKDKFEFFKGLTKVVSAFSERLLRNKVIPILVSECERDVRLAPVLLRPILQFSKNLPMEIFTQEVYLRLFFLTSIVDPPEILIAFMQELDLLLDKTDPAIHHAKVFPVISTALKSSHPLLLTECLKRLPAFIKLLNEQSIQKGLLPLLLRLCESSDDLEFLSISLNCITCCLPKVDHDQFMRYLIPKIEVIWRTHQEPSIVPGLSDLLTTLRGTDLSTMAFAIPLAAQLVSNSLCDPYYQKQLVSWMLGFVTKFKIVNKLDEVEDPKPGQVEIAPALDPLAQAAAVPASQSFDFSFGPLLGPQPPAPPQDVGQKPAFASLY
jgi:hypothetical protein